MGSLTDVPEGSPFSLDNIPFGVFSTKTDSNPRCATAIGDHAVDLKDLSKSGVFSDHSIIDALSQPTLNTFSALPAKTRTHVREQIIAAAKNGKIPESSLHKLEEVKMHLPLNVTEYTDFFCSLEHGTNCAAMMKSPLSENFLHAPAAYNGRASSVVPSPSVVRRPKGVYWQPGADGKRKAVFGPEQHLDYELEVGYFVSKPVPYGTMLNVDDAPEHIFGFVLLNDWSSRDIQAFEMPPLGPFNSKSTATTISPWIITLDALNAFKTQPMHKFDTLDHLNFKDFAHGTFDVKLSAHLERGGKQTQLATSNLKYLYWTPFQQLTHHTTAGCGLRTGDLMGTGTVSGDAVDEKTGKKFELGCLFEATVAATQPIRLEGGDELTYLKDGDSIVLDAWCEDGSGRKVLGFGECRGLVVGADEAVS